MLYQYIPFLPNDSDILETAKINEANSMKKAFTILELVIVVAIISVITTMLLTTFTAFKEKYADVDTSILDDLEEEYNFTYYDDLILPEPIDYKAILESYGIDVSNLTDEEIKELIKEIKNMDD